MAGPEQHPDAKKQQACLKDIAGVQRRINRLVALINGPDISVDQIRNLNNELNQAQQEKQKFEKQLVKLGGPNYIYQEYKFSFYGRASELPEATTTQFSETRIFTPEYYGFSPQEREAEKAEYEEKEQHKEEWGEFPIPTQADIEKEIIAARRAKLEQQYFK